MIPIRDEIKASRTPYVNYILIAINVAVFLFTWLNQANIQFIFSEYGLIPAQVTDGLDAGDIQDFITSLFLHGGWMHLIGNMLYLWIFGDNIEDRLGHVGYIIFYLLGGVIASLFHVLVNPNSMIPTVGASGAIAAVLGAYLVLYPNSRVYTFVPIGFFARLTLLPSIVVLGLWFILQIFSGVGSLGYEDAGTAYWAHIGGFVFGLVAGFFAKKRVREPQPAPPHWT